MTYYGPGGPMIGIDLGTTYWRVGVYTNGKVEIISKEPCWVAFTDDSDHPLVGEAAKNQSAFNPERTIFDVKRLLGRKFDDPEVQRDMKMLPYQVVNKEGKPYVSVTTKNGTVKTYSPEEICGMVLRKLKESAESYLGVKVVVSSAVITVPEYFNEAQRQATMDAAALAGFTREPLLYRESATALMAYGLDEKEGENINVLLLDLGGGTFDVTILNLDDRIKRTLSRTHLGGEDHFVKLIKDKYEKDITRDNKALGKLRTECERAKIELSNRQHAYVRVDGISEPLTRAMFEELNGDLFHKITVECIDKALKEANVTKSEIDEMVLLGGNSGIPKVQQLLKDYFDGKEATKKEGVNPDEAVCCGATWIAGQDPELLL